MNWHGLCLDCGRKYEPTDRREVIATEAVAHRSITGHRTIVYGFVSKEEVEKCNGPRRIAVGKLV